MGSGPGPARFDGTQQHLILNCVRTRARGSRSVKQSVVHALFVEPSARTFEREGVLLQHVPQFAGSRPRQRSTSLTVTFPHITFSSKAPRLQEFLTARLPDTILRSGNVAECMTRMHDPCMGVPGIGLRPRAHIPKFVSGKGNQSCMVTVKVCDLYHNNPYMG
jgi:hypothetical protein